MSDEHENGDLKRCLYSQRDKSKCPHYQQHRSDKGLCYWEQRGFKGVCTYCICFSEKKKDKPRGIGSYRVDTY